MIFLADGISWFPQEYANVFWTIKGLVALASTLMLVYHMNTAWERLVRFGNRGQRMRYLCLLAFSILVTGSSAEQIATDALVNYRNLGGFFVTLFLIAAMAFSIHEDVQRRKQ